MTDEVRPDSRAGSPKSAAYLLLASAIALGGVVFAFWIGIRAGRALDHGGRQVTVAPAAAPAPTDRVAHK